MFTEVPNIASGQCASKLCSGGQTRSSPKQIDEGRELYQYKKIISGMKYHLFIEGFLLERYSYQHHSKSFSLLY